MKKKLLKISLVGKTNAGKSSLINNIIGETVSITNKKINTTEELIEGIKNIEDNQLIFYDTPGLNFAKDVNKKNKKLKKNLWEGLNKSDLIIYIIDISKYNQKESLNYLDKIKELKKQIIVVFNKNDLKEKNFALPIIKTLSNSFKIDSFFSISAKYNLGVDYLTQYILTKTYNAKWIYSNEEISNKDDIFITNECTRNAILNSLHKEIPYNINIINKKYKFLKNGHLKIRQNIEINNSRYKKIILGRNGDKIKEIRINSQNNISKILKTKVHLYLTITILNAKEI